MARSVSCRTNRPAACCFTTTGTLAASAGVFNETRIVAEPFLSACATPLLSTRTRNVSLECQRRTGGGCNVTPLESTVMACSPTLSPSARSVSGDASVSVAASCLTLMRVVMETAPAVTRTRAEPFTSATARPEESIETIVVSSDFQRKPLLTTLRAESKAMACSATVSPMACTTAGDGVTAIESTGASSLYAGARRSGCESWQAKIKAGRSATRVSQRRRKRNCP